VKDDIDYLTRPVESLPKIAAQRLKMLHTVDIYTIYDLISYFPRSYENWSEIDLIDSLTDGQEASFVAEIRQKTTLQRKGRLSILRTVLSDESGSIRAVWFNQPYLQDKLAKGTRCFFHGKVRRDGVNFDITNPVIEFDYDPSAKRTLKSYYPLTKGLKQGVLRAMIADALPQAIPRVQEMLPAEVRAQEKLCHVAYAYEKIHFPQSEEEQMIARKRLIYEELYLVQGGLRWMKRKNEKDERAYAIALSSAQIGIYEKAIRDLPYTLTSDQNETIAAILSDMKKEIPMNRLVQGDVGSGKTIVAALALLCVALSGRQGVLMVPTSVLAKQHFRTLSNLFATTGVKISLLLGSTPVSEKRMIREGLRTGEIGILIGTHAVLSEKICFASLALTITDEQHRFGVKQRMGLASGSQISPHTLVMSATPIPRTLALILYGDLDISVISGCPAGRLPIETYTASAKDEKHISEIVKKQVDAGRQVYYVCPVIDSQDDESEEKPSLRSAVDHYHFLANELFPDFHIGLLHGGQKPTQKDQVMEQFASGEIQILVATTVVEVGVDNPNASLMIIENAERFGLSQLHQLRGRIGRGEHRSVCILKSECTDGISLKRLKVLCKTLDGFEIARQDLRLRGPGDFFGTRQHGIPALRIANLYRDMDVLERVSKALDRLFESEVSLSQDEMLQLIEAFNLRFQNEFDHPTL